MVAQWHHLGSFKRYWWHTVSVPPHTHSYKLQCQPPSYKQNNQQPWVWAVSHRHALPRLQVSNASVSQQTFTLTQPQSQRGHGYWNNGGHNTLRSPITISHSAAPTIDSLAPTVTDTTCTTGTSDDSLTLYDNQPPSRTWSHTGGPGTESERCTDHSSVHSLPAEVNCGKIPSPPRRLEQSLFLPTSCPKSLMGTHPREPGKKRLGLRRTQRGRRLSARRGHWEM